MPRYEYTCPGDGEVIIIERSIHDDDPGYDCPICGTDLERVYEAPPVRFEGVGFYSTDNPKR